MRITFVLVTAFLVCFQALPDASAMGHRLGGGAHYWVTVNNINIDEDVDDSGVAWLISYQYLPIPLLKIEVDLEIFPDTFGGAGETVLAPQIYGFVGSSIYAGIGAGVFYANGDVSNNPFFVLRGGVDFEILPGLFIDVNANYLFTNFDDLSETVEEIDTDTVTLGAMVRVGF